jgi:hypothetical protein
MLEELEEPEELEELEEPEELEILAVVLADNINTNNKNFEPIRQFDSPGRWKTEIEEATKEHHHRKTTEHPQTKIYCNP